MKAIEFNTIIEADGVIELPDYYKNKCEGPAKVIILQEEVANPKDKVEQEYAKVKEIIKAIQD
ncbi:hypothetical protein [Adhaeribacter radiodurans]|uniref:Uncharacterized protein n=1 Tax=Adhaeribacter radiodurans TaxID=2745197 RepID=A0A7L7LBR7_9BACT|nr:hypothetical protein [Adhaeribacter radiodurans]QMU30280.1 hypothetical protein HUW48_20575 [Adhaeribacter radiodurans]